MTERLINRILVVDDDEDYRFMGRSLLARLGYQCQTARDGFEAIEILGAEPFDLVISDIRMKGKDGVALLREARARHPHLDFIIMTGYSSEHSYCDVIGAGATDYLTKPFDMGELTAKLKRIEREKEVLCRLKSTNEELRRSFEKLRKTMEGTVQAMARAVEMRDPYTAGHQRRVAALACALAREMGLPQDQVEGIHMAGLIHDLGKIAVPAEILSKPDRLTEIEFAMIKIHPQMGYDILKNIEFPWPIAQIVLQHHEKVDGSGYPHGLTGREILIEAQVLTVADVVEAMASHRPYRPALGIDFALNEISKSDGSRFNHDTVAVCLDLFRNKGFQLEA